MFKEYPSVKRYGSVEVKGIEKGECYIFPKIDGSNGSLWLEGGVLQAGSRRRHLSLDNDNAGFYEWALKQNNILKFFEKHPNVRLYGEWLVPHTLRTYEDGAWKKFYVFDVAIVGEERLLHYNEYQKLLDEMGIDYIPAISILENAKLEDFVKELDNNKFLIKNGLGIGEGIVIKNYAFENKYSRRSWAKIVSNEFKASHLKNDGAPRKSFPDKLEKVIVDEFLTKSMIEKVFANIESANGGFSGSDIPRLLNTCYYDLVREEIWAILKKHKNPVIDFNDLRHFAYEKVKENFPLIF